MPRFGLRSSVDLVFALFAGVTHIIAITNADSVHYLAVGWIERIRYIRSLVPAWHSIINIGNQLWIYSEFAFKIMAGNLQKLFSRFLKLHPLREVILNSNVVRQSSTRVMDGGKIKLIPKQCPVFTVISKNNLAIDFLAQRPPDLVQSFLVTIIALEKSAITADAIR